MDRFKKLTIPNIINAKKFMPMHIIIKLPNTKDKENLQGRPEGARETRRQDSTLRTEAFAPEPAAGVCLAPKGGAVSPGAHSP